MKKLVLIFLLITSAYFTSNAQLIDENTIVRIISDNISRTYEKPITQKVVLFSVYLYVNPSGEIDSVGHSQTKGAINLQNVINTKVLLQELRKNKLLINRRNSLVVVPFMIWLADDISATHINELLGDFSSLFPTPEILRGRKLWLNKPQTKIMVIDD